MTDDSPDNDIDYQIMYPVAGRTRRSRSSSIRKRTKQTDSTSIHPLERRATKQEITCGKFYDDDLPRGDSLLTAARKLICKNIALKTAALADKLEAMGYETSPSTVGIIRMDTRAILKVAQDLNIDLRALKF